MADLQSVIVKKAIALKELKNAFFNQRVRVGGIISKIKKIITKNGKTMLFVSLEDLTDKVEVVVFPSILEKNPTPLQENKIVFVSGRVDFRDATPKLLAERIEEIIIKEG